MIRNLRISYEYDGITYNLDVPTDYIGENHDNTPYNLAAAFAEVMRKSDVNIDMVIDRLRSEFLYEGQSD